MTRFLRNACRETGRFVTTRFVLGQPHGRGLFLLASWTLADSAHASYAQMRLEGVSLLLVFVLTMAYGVIVDIALLARLFRYRASLIVGSIVALAVIFLFLGQTASPSERAGFFNVFSGGSGLVLLVVTGTVFLPFVVIAPFAQYLSMRDGRQWPGWITAWMALQLALLPGFIVLAVTDHYFWQHESRVLGRGGRGSSSRNRRPCGVIATR